MPYVMQIVMRPVVDKAQHSAELMTGDYPTRFLQAFDPDAHKGRGRIKTTTDVTSRATNMSPRLRRAAVPWDWRMICKKL